VNVVRLPARSPNLNPHSERFVLSRKSECLDRLVPLGAGHLRRAISEYMRHYCEWNHQGLENTLIDGISQDTDGIDPVARRKRLGGLLNFYFQEAA
jgi:putative transposase